MCPIVMSTTYGEREGKLDLATAWEILGGLPCSGICGYIEDISVLENDEGYNKLIETNPEFLKAPPKRSSKICLIFPGISIPRFPKNPSFIYFVINFINISLF